MSSAPVIAIDGPGGSGKGTLCRRLARHLGWHYLDSGALYRVLALRVQDAGVGEDEAATLAAELDLEFALDSNEVLLAGQPVAGRLRGEDVGALASRIATRRDVREALLARQRVFARPPGLIADGRDMGTVVFCDAPLKIFLEASPEVRARRRHEELLQNGKNANFDKIFREVSERDARDRNRAVAPLKAADDAIELDTTSKTVDEVFDTALAMIADRGIGID